MTRAELDDVIRALENSSCTFNNCQKLASLYICREYFQQGKKVASYSKNGQKFEDLKSI